MKKTFLILSMLLCILINMANSENGKITPVTGFVLNKYLGKWYEIARLPAWFEKDLVNVTATYTIRDDGKVKVFNQGYKLSKNGRLKDAIGKAKFKDKTDEGHLRVSFFGPFYGDYIIAELEKDYKYALVITPNDYMWILCREPKLDKEICDRLIEKAKSLGIDTSKLYFTPQEW